MKRAGDMQTNHYGKVIGLAVAMGILLSAVAPSFGEERIMVVMPARPTKDGAGSAVLPSINDIDDQYFDTTKSEVESLAEYFNEISYGNLTITGQVTPWMELPWRITPNPAITTGSAIPSFPGEDYDESSYMYPIDANGENGGIYAGAGVYSIQPGALLRPVDDLDGWWTPGERFLDIPNSEGELNHSYDAIIEVTSPGHVDADGDGEVSLPEPFEDFLRIYVEGHGWVRVDPSGDNPFQNNEINEHRHPITNELLDVIAGATWSENYIRQNYPGNAQLIIDRCGNDLYDGPDQWDESGSTSKFIVYNDPDVGTKDSWRPDAGRYSWNYFEWWEAYWQHSHEQAGITNPPDAPSPPKWGGFFPIESIPEIFPFDQNTPRPWLGGDDQNSIPFIPNKGGQNASYDPLGGKMRVGSGQLPTNEELLENSIVLPDTDGFYDGPAEFSDMPSSKYHARSIHGLDGGGDGRLGEVTSPRNSSMYGQDFGTEDPNDQETPDGDGVIPAAGPMAYNIHGTNGYDAGNQLSIEFKTWFKDLDDGEFSKYMTFEEPAGDPCYNNQPIDCTPKPEVLPRDYNLDGLLDQGPVRLAGTENYIRGTCGCPPNDGDIGEAYPFNRRRLLEDLIEANDPQIDWDNLTARYGEDQDQVIFSVALLPQGDYYQSLENAGAQPANMGLFLHTPPTLDWDVFTNDTEDPIIFTDFAAIAGTKGENLYPSPADHFMIEAVAHSFLEFWEGYPDLYDYDIYGNQIIEYPVGMWDIMANGGLVHPSPVLKERGVGNEDLGTHKPWIETKDLTTVLEPLEETEIEIKDYAFNPKDSVFYYDNPKPPLNPNFDPDKDLPERFYFYRLTDRAMGGNQVNFSRNLPGEGLMLMHVDSTTNDEALPAQQRVGEGRAAYKIIQADGDHELEKGSSSGDAGDPFPGTKGTTVWNNTTDPSNEWYDKTDSGLEILDIREQVDRTFVTFKWKPPNAASVGVD